MNTDSLPSIRVYPCSSVVKKQPSGNKLQPEGGEGRHAQQEQAMAPALDIRLAVSASLVTDGQVDDAQVQLRRAEQQVKIAKRIKIAKVGPIARDGFVILFEKHLGAAQGVLERLTQQPRKSGAKKLVRDHIQKPHRLMFHRINQANAVDEIRRAGTGDLVKFR